MKKIMVGYQGEHGTFSEIAVHRYYGDLPFEARSYTNFKTILEDLDKGILDTAILPVENSTTGMIVQTMDKLKEYDVFAIGEAYVKIEEHLIGYGDASVNDVIEVYSHPEALSQCHTLFQNYPMMQAIPFQDTAKSVAYIQQCCDVKKGAIASELAAKYYECPILIRNVNDEQCNTTRFLCICKGQRSVRGANKISLYFVLNNEPGSLYQVIKILAENSVNMVKLESRPIKGRLFESCFYIDVEGNYEEPLMQEVLKQVEKQCVEMKCLGTYCKAMED